MKHSYRIPILALCMALTVLGAVSCSEVLEIRPGLLEFEEEPELMDEEPAIEPEPEPEEWPEPRSTLQTSEGGMMLILMKAEGGHRESPHTYWWSWDSQSPTDSAKLELMSPEPAEDGTFPVNTWLQFLLSNYKEGDHMLRVRFRNEEYGNVFRVCFAVHVGPKKVYPDDGRPTIIGWRTSFYWHVDDEPISWGYREIAEGQDWKPVVSKDI